jgi:predicted Rossmann fold nucleotide-binding protein DprA/Smf involved in DNA uptake
MAPVKTIISGGQTGADRAALDFALANGFEITGYCPNGRRADDGPLDPKYPLQETSSRAYAPRTRKNVILEDVTVIFHGLPELSSGSYTTIRYARQHKKIILR